MLLLFNPYEDGEFSALSITSDIDMRQGTPVDDTAWLVDCVLTVDGNPSSIAVINAG